ncbi:Gfo/Idh/MocA family protein [Aureibaculum luteum]|uniref:Gfo/Idh/MocA family protein n=1 Tax=Aureibaculum luteum TaxID=1548456 RepID=UPI000E54DEA1|nr:Gfo/Idh/MocA family oxidoreductase [Aureibaculum luteum]
MDRRKFIKKSGTVSAALLGTSTILAGVGYGFSDDKNINIAVIGTGDRGKGLMPLLNSIENVTLYACCDSIPFRLEEGLKRAGENVKGYADYKELLKDKAIDAVIVSTTFNMHDEIAMAAVKANKHVYCEKTLAKGYDGINHLLNSVKSSNKIFQSGHQYHCSKLYEHIVALIKKGKVGKIAAFECQWNRHGDWRRKVDHPDMERIINWRMYKEYSGGLTAELCSHQIDFVNWVLEANPEKVMGTGGVDYWKDGRETYDNVHLIYSYPNGVNAKFSCLTSNANEGYQIKIMGDKGTILLDYDKATFYPEGKTKAVQQDVDGVSGATAKAKYGYGEAINIEHEEPTKQAMIDFRDNILNNTMPKSNVITGAKAAICVQMGLDAMYNETIVHWNPKFNNLG